MNLRKYYTMEVCQKIFDSVENPHLKVWKIKEADNKCRQARLPMNSPKRLYKFIQSGGTPLALYVSISQFLNAHKNHGFFSNQDTHLKDHYFYPREGYTTADCILLHTIYFIDLDHPTNLRLVQREGRKIIRQLGPPLFLRYSGTKGIHLGYPQPLHSVADPSVRITLCKKQKEEITKQLVKLNLQTIDKVHEAILNDPFRVIAAPYSVKQGGGIVLPLDVYEFTKKDIFKLIPTSEEKSDDMQVATEGQPSTQPYQAGGRASLSSQPLYFKFVDNMVAGLKNSYVTVIKKHVNKFSVKKLKALQRAKNLSDFIIYRLGNYVYAVNLKVNDFAGTAKILKKAQSENLMFFLTRKHAPIPVSNQVDKEGNTLHELKKIGILKSPLGRTHFHSQPHSRVFGVEYDFMIGTSNRLATMQVS